jgi:hypothetical protein
MRGKPYGCLKDCAVGVGATAWSDVFVEAIVRTSDQLSRCNESASC